MIASTFTIVFDRDEIKKCVTHVAENAHEVGLFINIDKTKTMTTCKNKTALNIKIDNTLLKQVNEFVYLGHTISSTNRHEHAVQNRIGLAWAAYSKNEHLLTSKRIPKNIKTKIYKTYILPVVLYGLDCVTWNDKLEHKIEVFQNHVTRLITGHRLVDKIIILI